MRFVSVKLDGAGLGMVRFLLGIAMDSAVLEGVEWVQAGVYYAAFESYQTDVMQQFLRLLVANEIEYELDYRAPDLSK